MFTLTKLSFAGTLPLLILLGCAHQKDRPVSLAPTSSSSAQRVYGTTIATAPNGAQAIVTRTNADAPSAAAAAGSSEELDVAARVQQMLLADRNLLPYPSKVVAAMHPSEKGTVVLSGAVPNGRVKRKLLERVAEVPGVSRVEDKVEIALPEKQGEVDLRQIVPQQ